MKEARFAMLARSKPEASSPAAAPGPGGHQRTAGTSTSSWPASTRDAATAATAARRGTKPKKEVKS